MTRDELIESALQCGVWIPMEHGQEREQTIDRLQRLVGRAVAAERGSCAAICDAEGREWDSDDVVTEKNYAAHCAHRIRARGDT